MVWHAGDGRKPDASHLTPKEAEAELRRILEHEAAKRPTKRGPRGKPVTFADAAEAWLRHGEAKRNLKRSTLRDYRQALDAYLLPAPADVEAGETPYGRAPFAETPLRSLGADAIKAWYDELAHSRTAEKLMMIVRAILDHARRRGWIDENPAAAVERQPITWTWPLGSACRWPLREGDTRAFYHRVPQRVPDSSEPA